MLSIFIHVFLHICNSTVPCIEGWVYNTYIFSRINSVSLTLLAADIVWQFVVRSSILFAKGYLAAVNPFTRTFKVFLDCKYSHAARLVCFTRVARVGGLVSYDLCFLSNIASLTASMFVA